MGTLRGGKVNFVVKNVLDSHSCAKIGSFEPAAVCGFTFGLTAVGSVNFFVELAAMAAALRGATH